MLTFDVITLVPQLFTAHLENLPFKRAVLNKIAKYNLVNLRDFALDSYGTVDDKTYGGGVGMILMIEPIMKALTKIYGTEEDFPKKATKTRKIVVLSPRGKTFTQETARELAGCEQVTLICGRYEGIDARIEEHIATDVISLGNFVLSGGELPALAIMESVTRLLPGVLEKKEASELESFSDETGKLEYPQYTHPEDYKGMKVPEILLSGDHGKIKKWRDGQMEKRSL
jgi:tRNA (guanine37-N1)-methyltransferase